MNFSRNVSLLKAIDVTLDDKVYVGVTESKGLLESIDENLVQIDSVLDSIKVDTNASNTHLSDISTYTENADVHLGNVESEVGNVNSKLVDIGITIAANDSNLSSIATNTANTDSSLNAMESDIDEMNLKLVDLGVTISRGNKFNLTQKHQSLQDSGSNRLIAADDFSSTPARLYFENNDGKPVVITKISCTFSSSETTWDKIFTSSVNGSLSYGIGNDNTGIDNTKLSFESNHEIQPYMSMVFSDPAGGDNMYYSYVIDGLNIKLDDGKFFLCELSGNYSATGDGSFCSSVVFDKYTDAAN